MSKVQLRFVSRVKDNVDKVGQQIDYFTLKIGNVIDSDITWEDCSRGDYDILTWTHKKGEEWSREKVKKQVLKNY